MCWCDVSYDTTTCERKCVPSHQTWTPPNLSNLSPSTNIPPLYIHLPSRRQNSGPLRGANSHGGAFRHGAWLCLSGICYLSHGADTNTGEATGDDFWWVLPHPIPSRVLVVRYFFQIHMSRFPVVTPSKSSHFRRAPCPAVQSNEPPQCEPWLRSSPRNPHCRSVAGLRMEQQVDFEGFCSCNGWMINDHIT